MSLISDALKKARQEAARQDSLRQGTPYAMGAAEAPSRAPWITLLAGLGVGCILAAAFFALAFFAGWGPFRKAAPPAPASRVAAATPAPVPPAPAASAPEAPAPAATIVETPAAPAVSATPPAAILKPSPPAVPRLETPAPPVPRPAPMAAAPSPLPVEAVPDPTPNTAPVPTAPAPEAPAPQPAASAAAPGGLEEGKVYTGEVPVPGGGLVKLNGIAYSQDHPVAVLDGRVMGPGESVGGFTIVAIESGRVKLQGHGATVYLAPR
jgi:hypothetical protein